MIVDIERGETLVTGLSCPHDPLRDGDAWLVCDSRTSRLLRVADDGTVLHAADVGGWSRGLLATGDELHVGVSTRRMHGGTGESGAIVTLRRSDLAELRRTPLPADEVFALALVPDRLIAGLEVGFSVNLARQTPLAPAATELASARSGRAEEPVITMSADVDEQPVLAGRYSQVMVTLRSDEENETLLPTGPAAWRLGARWTLDDGTTHDEGARALLSAPLLPGDRATCRIHVRAPDRPGRHRLELGLLQELVRWHGTAHVSVDVDVHITA